MDVYRTEEEQISAIQEWWKKNGQAVIWGILISLLILFGWKMYKNKSVAEAEQAFSLFIAVSDAMEAATDVPAGSAEDKTVITEAEKLFAEFPNHTYAHLGALLTAKHDVNFERWSDAETRLRWALEQNPESSLRILTKSRLARLLIQQNNYDEALKLLSSESNLHDFSATYDELKGDIYLLKGDESKARGAYKTALAQSQDNNSLLKMKLDDLAVHE